VFAILVSLKQRSSELKTTAPLGKPVRSAPATADAATIERAIKVAIDALKEMGVRDECSILVGGGFVDKRSALAVGADAYWQDVSVAAKATKASSAKQ
jgi:methanogenic corrinoid protein MtbC1